MRTGPRLLGLALLLLPQSYTLAQTVTVTSEAGHAVFGGLTPALVQSRLAAQAALAAAQVAAPEPKPIPRTIPKSIATDPLIASGAGPRAAMAPLAMATAAAANKVAGFAGVGAGDYGFQVASTPPDTNLAVGTTQIIQWVNTSFAIFDKSGNKIAGPLAGNTLWSTLTTGPGAGCSNHNDGDPIVKWDTAADRWVMMQFVVSNGSNFLQCVAVSQTADATGAWNVYAFPYTSFPDYPKAAVWPDAYYVTFNMFNAAGTSFLGSQVCAYDRAAMLAGTAATQVCVQLSSAYGGVLPADPDGASAVAAGAPAYLLTYDNNLAQLDLWRFHPNFGGTASIDAAPIALPIAAFTPAASVPQLGSTLSLDSLSDRPMYRLAYRLRNGIESLFVTHAVATGASGQSAVRWYEVQSPATTPVLAQQGTFAPDTSLWRWMSTGAIDGAGNMAIGYSTSSSAAYPSLAVAARLATDPPNTMGSETVAIAGTGSETRSGTAYTRWGDYASMVVDPVDDSTMWFTSLYQKTSGQFAWSTWIHAFRIGMAIPTPALAASPTSLSFGAVAGQAAQSVTLSSNGTAAVTINSIALTGTNTGFSQTHTCGTLPATLAPAATCTVAITFAGSTTLVTDKLAITTDAATSPSIALSGGAAPALTLTPTSLTFATQNAGTTSSAKTVTVKNAGTAPMSSISAALTGTNAADYRATNSCKPPLAAAASCSISVKFAPAVGLGAEAATLSVTTSGGNGSVALSGTSAAVTRTVTFTPATGTPFAFGNLASGGSSTLSVATLRNTGTSSLTVATAISGSNASLYTVRSQTGSCGSTLSAGSSCQVFVRFKPTSKIATAATLTVSTNATTAPSANYPLTGTGI